MATYHGAAESRDGIGGAARARRRSSWPTITTMTMTTTDHDHDDHGHEIHDHDHLHGDLDPTSPQWWIDVAAEMRSYITLLSEQPADRSGRVADQPADGDGRCEFACPLSQLLSVIGQFAPALIQPALTLVIANLVG